LVVSVDVAVAVAANVIVAALVSGNDTVGEIDIVDGQGPDEQDRPDGTRWRRCKPGRWVALQTGHMGGTC
jgi:hypothetical protein